MGFTLCTMACHPLGEYQLGPATKCQLQCELKRELRVVTSLFTPRWELANQSQPPSVSSSVSYKCGYISGWHNGLTSCTMACRPLGECQLSPATKCQLKRKLRAATRPSQQCHPPGAARRIAQQSYYKLTGCVTASRWARRRTVRKWEG